MVPQFSLAHHVGPMMNFTVYSFSYKRPGFLMLWISMPCPWPMLSPLDDKNQRHGCLTVAGSVSLPASSLPPTARFSSTSLGAYDMLPSVDACHHVTPPLIILYNDNGSDLHGDRCPVEDIGLDFSRSIESILLSQRLEGRQAIPRVGHRPFRWQGKPGEESLHGSYDRLLHDA